MSENQLTRKCPIWGTPAYVGPTNRERRLPVYSPRAGGWYEIYAFSLDDKLKAEGIEDDQAKARLTTMLVDQRMQGNDRPYIDDRHIKAAKRGNNISVPKRANRLLKYLSKKSEENFIGYIIDINSDSEMRAMALHVQGRSLDSKSYQDSIKAYQESLAWSESVKWDEIRFLIDYLSHADFLEVTSHNGAGLTCRVTLEGYARIEEEITNRDISQAFVAMWFDKEMDEAYEEGIKKAIENAGYISMRIDKKEDVNKIDDEIIAEIRRSRFLVADFTHGKDGARGDVYYEAGFAKGFGIPVIRSCHKDKVKNLRLHTRQYYHVVWENHEQLKKGLEKRILALIGEGPGTTETGS